MLRRGFVIASILTLAGCTKGPDYVRPTAPTSAEFKEAQGWKVAQPGDELPRGAWWTLFGDEELNALEAQIDISSQTVAVAAARVREAQALSQAARASFFPVATGNATATRSRSSEVTRNNFNVGLGASWELDLWGRVQRTVEAADANVEASVADLEAVKLAAQAELAQDYLLLRVQDAVIALLQESVAAYERSLQLTTNQFNVGVVGKVDVAQAEVQLKSTQAQLIDAGVVRAQLEHAIAVLIGKPPAELALAHSPVRAVFPDIPLALPSELLERRPDIAAAERRIAAANAEVGVAEAAFFPSLTLSGTLGFQSSVLSRLLSAPSLYWSIGPALAQTLFDAGLRRAKSAQALAAYDESVATYRQTVLTSFQEVEDNLAALRILAQEADVQDDAVRAVRQVVTIRNNQYRAGIASYLEVVIAQAAALNNERTAINLLGRRLNASVNLIKALGGGWHDDRLAQAMP
jgi:NodT family efflux transporter outer membrane factor (OMF) lipoprotein